MIKTLEFGEKSVSFSTSFAWVFNYKAQFGRDAAKVLMPVIKEYQRLAECEEEMDRIMKDEKISIEEKAAAQERYDEEKGDLVYKILDVLGYTGLAEIAWSMAKLLDQRILTPAAWVASFGDDFSVLDVITDLLPEVVISCFATKKSKAPEPPKKTTKAQKKGK